MNNIVLQADMSIEPGHQWIELPVTTQGLALGKLLTGVEDMFTYFESNEQGLFIKIAHTAEVDARIVELVDQLAHVRFSAPGLVQMVLEESTAMPTHDEQTDAMHEMDACQAIAKVQG